MAEIVLGNKIILRDPQFTSLLCFMIICGFGDNLVIVCVVVFYFKCFLGRPYKRIKGLMRSDYFDFGPNSLVVLKRMINETIHYFCIRRLKKQKIYEEHNRE